MNIARVTPPLGQKCNHKMNFICNPIHCLLEPSLDEECNTKALQKEVDHHPDLDESQTAT